MKRLIHFVMLLMVICGMNGFSSCTELTGTFSGVVCATPDSAKVGETVVLSLGSPKGSIVSVAKIVQAKGKCHEIANYYIDGKKVAESTDGKNDYPAEYIIKEKPGEHELSVIFTSNADEEDIQNNVLPSKIIVIE